MSRKYTIKTVGLWDPNKLLHTATWQQLLGGEPLPNLAWGRKRRCHVLQKYYSNVKVQWSVWRH